MRIQSFRVKFFRHKISVRAKKIRCGIAHATAHYEYNKAFLCRDVGEQRLSCVLLVATYSQILAHFNNLADVHSHNRLIDLWSVCLDTFQFLYFRFHILFVLIVEQIYEIILQLSSVFRKKSTKAERQPAPQQRRCKTNQSAVRPLLGQSRQAVYRQAIISTI